MKSPFDSPAIVRQMQVWQEDQVRRTTRALGFDPLALPADDGTGKVDVKALIRSRCSKNEPVKMRAKIFNKAWERMLAGTPPTLRFKV